MIAFKNRNINFSDKVQIYRNLNGDSMSKYSIRQRGLVVAHCHTVEVIDAEFFVSQAGRGRVLASGKKNVHAWVSGKIINPAKKPPSPLHILSYNPYFCGSFFSEAKNGGFIEVKEAPYVYFGLSGVFFSLNKR